MIRSFFSMLLVGVAGLALAPGLLQGCTPDRRRRPVHARAGVRPDVPRLRGRRGQRRVEELRLPDAALPGEPLPGASHLPLRADEDRRRPAVQSSGAPYNDADGHPIGACVLPFGGLDSASTGLPVASGEAVTGSASDTTDGALVEPQCVQRTANLAVYCSCRCANINNADERRRRYCACPTVTCTQLVTPIGATDTGLTGAYCIQNGTQYDSINQCASASDDCDATSHNCGTFNGQ